MWTTTACLATAFILIINFRRSCQISCKDENDEDVDWYINYKLPKITSEPKESDLAKGIAYAYIVAPGSDWKLSTKNVDAGSGSMLENTMEEFYSNKKKLTYLFYNDDVPTGFKGTASGHLKGVVAFNKDTGFWLIHSIPRFPDDSSYEYPDNALSNGQSILCVTFRTDELNEISNQLLYDNPNIYSQKLTKEVEKLLDDKAQSLFSDDPEFITKEPLTRTATLTSLGNKVFKSFAKDNQHKDDLYGGLIAPGLKTSLMTETWRKGSGGFLRPLCNSDYTILDVKAINMTAKIGRKKKYIAFKSTKDHSKWAVADDSKKNWICIGDMNRMASQENRGGGALCFTSAPVRRAFESIIDKTDKCRK